MASRRTKVVIRTSIVSILANLVLVGFKATVGLLANSIAIITDAINNLSDALSSIITIVGIKLAGKAPDEKHPFGHGRIEYVTSLIVSIIVLYAGLTALVESVKKIITPEAVDYNIITLIVLAASITIKLLLGLYVKSTGRHIKSAALVASGTDAFNDALLTASVLASAIVYMFFQIDLAAYVGVLVSAYIIKTGVTLIKGSVDSMLGVRIDSHLAQAIRREVLKEPGVEDAYDLVLHDYGPEQYLGSVHIAVSDTLAVTQIDQISQRITERVVKKFGITLHTIGVHPVGNVSPQNSRQNS